MKKNVIAIGLAAAVALTSQAALAGDAANGEALAKRQCVACHTFEDGGAHKVGPNLWMKLAKGPGTSEGFKYSPGFTAAVATGFTWDDANLDAYLTDPTAFLREVSGDAKARSRMTFKMPKAEDRADVIAYMRTLQ